MAWTLGHPALTQGFVVVRRVVVRVLDVTTGLTGTMVVALESVRTTAPVESTWVDVERWTTGAIAGEATVLVLVVVLTLSVRVGVATGTATGTATAAGGVLLSLTVQAAREPTTMAAKESERRTADTRIGMSCGRGCSTPGPSSDGPDEMRRASVPIHETRLAPWYERGEHA